MCTVSVFTAGLPGSAATGFRVVCNRDESRDRARALPAHWRTIRADSPARAIWPIDAEAGGTWIAASDRGLVLCLLNLNIAPSVGPTAASSKSKGMVSRGLIIPELIGESSAAAAIAALGALDLNDYAPFRLVAVELPEGDARPRWIETSWDRSALRVSRPGSIPVCFTSSGLGDHFVAPRLALFDQMVLPAPTREAQDRFHRHRWQDRPELSVMMSREDARTVSVTSVDVLRAGSKLAVDMRCREAAETQPDKQPDREGGPCFAQRFP